MDKVVVLLVGPQGSGKSTYCRDNLPGYLRISQDEQGRAAHFTLFTEALERGEPFVVIDRINALKSQRKRYLDVARQHGYLTHIVWLNADRNLCLTRCRDTADHPTLKPEDADKALQLYFNSFQVPSRREADTLTILGPPPVFVQVHDLTEHIGSRRHIIVGDVHGCYDELRELLDQLQFEPDRDVLISVGDIVDRGPKVARNRGISLRIAGLSHGPRQSRGQAAPPSGGQERADQPRPGNDDLLLRGKLSAGPGRAPGPAAADPEDAVGLRRPRRLRSGDAAGGAGPIRLPLHALLRRQDLLRRHQRPALVRSVAARIPARVLRPHSAVARTVRGPRRLAGCRLRLRRRAEGLRQPRRQGPRGQGPRKICRQRVRGRRAHDADRRTAQREEYVVAGLLRGDHSDDGALAIYTYTDQCVYDSAWDQITRNARGHIYNMQTGECVAWPFPKFFNLGENQENLPENFPWDQPYEIYEKMDGWLGVLYRHEGQYKVASRGSFHSSGAVWATEFIQKHDLSCLPDEATLCFEIIHPDHRIILDYGGKQTLIVLAAFNRFTGVEYPRAQVEKWTAAIGLPIVPQLAHLSLTDLLHSQKGREAFEGFVIRFGDGRRVKVKTEWYLQIARVMSNLNPITVWEVMAQGKVQESYLIEVPEELRPLAEKYKAILEGQYARVLLDIEQNAAPIVEKFGSDRRTLALYMNEHKTQLRHVKPAVFLLLDGKRDRLEKVIMDLIYPRGNQFVSDAELLVGARKE